MRHIFSYRDDDIYSHHTIDESPVPDSFQMHAHEWMEVFYLVSGKGSYLVEGSQYDLLPGDILIMRAAETHKINISPDEPYERISLHFSPSVLDAIPGGDRLLKPFMDRPLGQHNLYRGQERLRAAFMGFDFEGVRNIRLNLLSRLQLFLTLLGAEYDRRSSQAYSADNGFQGQLVAYVNEHLFEDISLQSIADAFYRSRSQISRVFRQATGSPLWEYVTIKRLLAAQAMLQRGESASTACVACGFSDYSSFFRAYRSYFKHSPKTDFGKELKGQ